jgi:hypothetical protein
MLAGNAIIYSVLATIALNGLPFPAVLDGVVWITVVLMIWARRVDIVEHQGTTASGEPATLAHWRSHAVMLVLVTAAASVVAHTVSV